MKRSLLVALLFVAASLFVVAQAPASVIQSEGSFEGTLEPGIAEEQDEDGSDMCAGCWDPPPPPPPPQPQPPPTPPPAPPPPPPPPTDWTAVYHSGRNPGSWAGDQGDWYACGVTAAQQGQWYSAQDRNIVFCAASTARCTKKVRLWQWSDIISRYFLMRMTIEVCYRHNDGIVTVLKRYSENVSTRYPYGHEGNAPGHPVHYRYARYVDFHFRHRLSYCPTIQIGCFPTVEPWVRLRFHDNNTMTQESGRA